MSLIISNHIACIEHDSHLSAIFHGGFWIYVFPATQNRRLKCKMGRT